MVMVIYTSVRRIMNYYLTPDFPTIIYIYPLRYIIYLEEPLGDIISNYHGTFVHLYMHWYYTIYLKNINETVVFPRFIWPFFCSHFFMQTIHQELYHYLQDQVFISFGISKNYIMSSPTRQYSPALYLFFIKEKTSAETATKLDIISSNRDDDHNRRLNEKNWQCLWCNQKFQGINATKALAHVSGKKGMHIKSCYVAKDKFHTTR